VNSQNGCPLSFSASCYRVDLVANVDKIFAPDLAHARQLSPPAPVVDALFAQSPTRVRDLHSVQSRLQSEFFTANFLESAIDRNSPIAAWSCRVSSIVVPFPKGNPAVGIGNPNVTRIRGRCRRCATCICFGPLKKAGTSGTRA